jgi:hypothetical protein
MVAKVFLMHMLFSSEPLFSRKEFVHSELFSHRAG